MRACTHAFTSQNGINVFGVKRLGVEILPTSTQLNVYIHGWFLWSIHTWMKYMDLCIWEFGASHYTYVESLGTICDYVIWWELKLLLTISKSTVEFWVGCYMFAVTMRACTHAFTSQNGINAFGVKRLGVEVWGISTFNSTQCLYSWMILVIYPYVDEVYGMITHIFAGYPLEKYILMMWSRVLVCKENMKKYLFPLRHSNSHG